ncbi:MAG: crossover junction endodeoxyribonuclease RuvC [Ruminococcaceae bacterium]|nr:crossover junction endodeoxyribonuclease RuvC [Oscillospiraceae bacterium]
MRILGIDPGYALVGIGAIEYVGNKYSVIKYGKIETFSKEEMSKRLETIFREMNLWLSETKPDVVAIEQLFFNTNTTTAIAVAQARGVILLACQLQGVPVFEYTPLQVKQAVVGYGKAEKIQVQKMVKTILNLEKVPKPDDTADALAIAICHTNHSGYHSYLDKLK